MATCPECQATNPPEAVVCAECGANIPAPKKVTVAQPQAADRLAEGILRGASILMVIVLVALVAFVGWAIISQGIESGAP